METFNVTLSFKGKATSIEISTNTTADELVRLAEETLLQACSSSATTQHAVKLLYKGQKLRGDHIVFSNVPKKTPKIMVLATQSSNIQQLNQLKQDKTIRGFDQEKPSPSSNNNNSDWGPGQVQDKQYKFCRFQACSWQSFGHRPNESTPHDFQARALLERLATDPGVVTIMRERQLVVGTLGEMDPIDDRLMNKKQSEGACLLGYNTNHGSRIDLKLRTDDLQGFRPYFELASTLIHELSHNWVGDHNLLFWSNYGQMRIEYLYGHYNNAGLTIVNGQTTAQRAGLPRFTNATQIYDFVMHELLKEMAQHGLHPSAIAATVQSRLDELRATVPAATSLTPTDKSLRELALEAAERRQKKDQNEKEE